MMRFYVMGGRQRPGVTDDVDMGRHYGAGIIAEVDAESGTAELRKEYVSPPEACADTDAPSILFGTATIDGDRAYVPTQTEVLTFDLPSFTQSGYISLPSFNDVHHVRPGPDGTLFIANTGLDMVVQVDLDGTVVREYSVLGEEPWKRFSRSTDYRKVVSTKPHLAHPNHVFFVDGAPWVTRCHQGDIVPLALDEPPIPLADKFIHDGLWHQGRIYFTVVSGDILIVDPERRAIEQHIDLNAITGGGTPLGWCRGIEVLDNDHVVVGFSRLRPTRWRQNIQWVKHRLGGQGLGLFPTRLVMFDLKSQRQCWEVDLEPAGLNVVFSVHRVPGLP